jgi:ribosome-associated toxin RatA of RatAB toxin-antitoxin module
MMQNMVEHHATVVVNAPVHQVYNLFCHFNDFPKFMRFIKEVTYYDAQRSHWVADVAGTHEWDAINEGWIPDQQIGWRSFNGLQNFGRVNFRPIAQNQTMVDVSVSYDPPAGVLGDIGERLGAGKHFDDVLQEDLNNFAKMVDQAPVNAQDPNWSQYLFHPESAAARGATTPQQNATMGGEFAAPESTLGYTRSVPGDPSSSSVGREFVPSESTQGYTSSPDDYMTRQGVPSERPTLDRDIINEPKRTSSPDEEKLPPEQIPPWSNSGGSQPQP